MGIILHKKFDEYEAYEDGDILVFKCYSDDNYHYVVGINTGHCIDGEYITYNILGLKGTFYKVSDYNVMGDVYDIDTYNEIKKNLDALLKSKNTRSPDD